jgi:hypothetical protein
MTDDKYQEGYDAFYDDKVSVDNPYPEGSDDYSKWDCGYWDAHDWCFAYDDIQYYDDMDSYDEEED